MRLKVFKRAAAVLVLVPALNGTPVMAQRTVTTPQRFNYFGEFFFPELPPIPPLPPLPPMPELEVFRFAFPQALRSGESTDPEVRFQQEVFRTLLRNNADRGIEIAAERLKADPDDQIVLGNLTSIANSGSPKSMALLLSVAKTSTNANARRTATVLIARSKGDKEAVTATILDILATNRDDESQQAALSALSELDSPRAVKMLSDIVRNKDRSIAARRSALGVVSRSGGSLATLEELYNGVTDSSELRRSILASISRSSDSRAVSILAKIAKSDADETMRRAAIQHLGTRKEAEAVKALEDLLKK